MAMKKLITIIGCGMGNIDPVARAVEECGVEALKQTEVSAVAAASIFRFTEMTPLEAKHFLGEAGVHVRI